MVTDFKLMLPAQIETLIANLNNKQEDVYVRQQYFVRLQDIVRAIEKYTDKFEEEIRMATSLKNATKKKKVAA